jgi:antitoxin component YwqK of YwqJK toxin-antitoxin module
MKLSSNRVLRLAIIASCLSPCLSLAGELEITTSLKSKQEPAAAPAIDKTTTLKTITEQDDAGNVVRKYTAKILGDGTQLKHGNFVEFYGNGEIYRSGRYQDGKRDDAWKYLDEKGQVVKTGRFANGLIDGKWEMFADGKRIRMETYQLGIPHGRWERYSVETGMVLETREFSNGKLHGTVSRSYPNGQPKEHAKYKQGKLNGVQRKWHRNGKQHSVASYLNGMRHGSFKEWRPNGSVIQDAQYQNDQLMFRTSATSSR